MLRLSGLETSSRRTSLWKSQFVVGSWRSQSTHKAYSQSVFTMHSQRMHLQSTHNFPARSATIFFTLPPRALRPEPPGPYPSPSLKSPASQNAEKRREEEEKKRRRTLIPPPRSVSESLPVHSHHASCRAFPGWGRMRLNPPTSDKNL